MVCLHGPVRCIIPIYVFIHLTIHSFNKKKTLDYVRARLSRNQNRALFAANHNRVFALDLCLWTVFLGRTRSRPIIVRVNNERKYINTKVNIKGQVDVFA